MTTTIQSVKAHQIFDSRDNPTVESSGLRSTMRGRARPRWPPACGTPTSAPRCTSPPGRARQRSVNSLSSSSASPLTPRTTMETVEYLLGRGADPSVASNMGATALHHAAGIGNDDAAPNGHIDIMKLLLGKGVDVESESESGTPLVWAAGHGQQDAVKLLIEHNAKSNTETADGITSLLSAVAAGSQSSHMDSVGSQTCTGWNYLDKSTCL
ncbi:ankyrin-2-like isoform X2 [Triticum dicoccoides]|uniref:ankyrin-2-like isoform X2 n=1 Tax=Triticum dicoccoides TaxID=85692 RepID=UPI00188F7884|nr:ankyrin-2-like isoform X2 [Triticum dicoccoides]